MRHVARTLPWLTAALLPACDLEAEREATTAEGPPLHVVATYPEYGQGTECGADAPDDCGVPTDAGIELRFDRFILPKSATRQSIRLYSAGPDALVFLVPSYDLVERVVTFKPAHGSILVPGALYQVDLAIPEENATGAGFRAFDGAPLARSGSVPLQFSFRVARKAAGEAAPERTVSCREALDAFDRGACTGCHRGDDAPLGLRLDTQAGLRETVIGQLSREVEGPNVEQVLVDPPHFGLGMPRIEEGSPSSSYLFYKLLLAPGNYGPGDGACRTVHSVALPEGTCLRPSEDERRRAANGFVRLDPMPPTGGLADGVADLRLIADYIRSGADTTNCE